jgi:hypothetical protein
MKTDRLREAALAHLRLLEASGQTRSEAAAELAALASSLAREGNAEWARILREESRRQNAKAEADHSVGEVLDRIIADLSESVRADDAA